MTLRRGLRRDDVAELLRELETLLEARGVRLDIQIVGGAALLLHGVLDRATSDIDARYADEDVVDEVAAEMAVMHGLSPAWLNRNAAAYLPDGARWMAGPQGMSSAIMLADLPTLAAMKMAAERTKDIEDLGHISVELGIEEAGELVRLAFDKYGEHSIALAAPVDNYELVAEEAMAAARALRSRRNGPSSTGTAPE